MILYRYDIRYVNGKSASDMMLDYHAINLFMKTIPYYIENRYSNISSPHMKLRYFTGDNVALLKLRYGSCIRTYEYIIVPEALTYIEEPRAW